MKPLMLSNHMKAPGMGDADVAELKKQNAKLRQDKRKAVAETKHLQEEVQNMTKEVRRLTVELEKFRHPPHIVGTVLDVLDEGRFVIKSSTGPNFVVKTSEIVNKDDIEIGTRVSLAQNNLTVVGTLPAGRDPIVKASQMLEKPTVTYDDIGGLDEVLLEVREAVEFPLTRPEAYEKLGIIPPKGVLLHGPPGTGKTLIAKATANATGATFLRLVGSELVQKFIGEGSRRVREVFQLAREKAPCVLFIDEIDAVGGKRTEDGTSSNREVERTLMQLLAELDGFNIRGDVRILAATNRSDILDPALLRPGRFDRIIEVPLPTEDGLLQILDLHTAGLTLRDVDKKDVLERLGAASGADVKAVCTEAGMHAVRHERDAITQHDFIAAITRLHRGTLVTHSASAADLYA